MTEIQNILRPSQVTIHQSGRMPVLEEVRTMDFVTNRNRITMAISIFKTLKMVAERGNIGVKVFAFIWLSFLLFYA